MITAAIVLVGALPPSLLLLAACSSPEQQPPPLAARVAQPTAQAKSAPIAGATVTNTDPTRALFIANCAQCHGETGDGEGVTQLERKARSFLAGGFSYGNTKDAILRSITHGIPGTPMPAFEKALNEEQRRALARYVIAFGPDQIVVDPSESEVVVKDRPLVVRGKLPPIVEGGPEIASGLAIGSLEGLTFEYRTDDVQLTGVRAGRFVNRTDSGERGGTALEMLGKPIWSNGAKTSPLLMSLQRDEQGQRDDPAGSEPRRTRLIATNTLTDRVEVEYEVTIGSGPTQRSAVVRESCASFRNEVGSGFRVSTTLRTEHAGLYASTANFGEGVLNFSGSGTTFIADIRGSKPRLYVARSPSKSRVFYVSLGPRLCVQLTPMKDVQVEVIVLTDLAKPLAWGETEVQMGLLEVFDA